MDKRENPPFCNPCQAYHDASTPCFDAATAPVVRTATAPMDTSAAFTPPAEDALHIAICQAVQEHHGPTANAILRTALNDYEPTRLTRTELIRVQQRSGSKDVTAVMTSRASVSAPPPDPFNDDRCMFCGGKTEHRPDCDHGVRPSAAATVDVLWEALKVECCKNPAEAKLAVFVSEQKFKKALARFAAPSDSSIRAANDLCFPKPCVHCNQIDCECSEKGSEK